MKSTVKGGDKLSKYLSDASNKLNTASKVDVGFIEQKTYPNGTSVPMVAAIQEYGASNARFPIPPRPYFRTMIKNKSPQWPAEISALLVANKYDTNKTLSQMGEVVAGELRESIINTNSPALSPVTIMLRAMTGPNGRPSGLSQVYEAINNVQSGITPDMITRSKRKQKKGRVKGTSTKPLVWTGVMLNSITYKVS